MCRRVFGSVVVLVVVLAGVGAVYYWLFTESVEVERDDRPPFRIDPGKPFLVALGRGSGWHGLSEDYSGWPC